MKEYNENLAEITKQEKDFMKDYKRIVVMNTEQDDANEILRRKEKRKKKKLQRSELEIERHELFAGEGAELDNSEEFEETGENDEAFE